MALPYTTIQSVTNELILNKVTEGVFKSNAVLERFRKMQALEEGGNNIKAPLQVVDDTGTTGEFYASQDVLSLESYDGISAGYHSWKQIYESVVIYKTEIAKNAGKYGVLKLIDQKVKLAENAMGQRIMKGIHSDGTVNFGALDADQFVGLLLAVKASGTYGSIPVADLAHWVSYVDSNASVNRALTQTILDKAMDQATEGDQIPNLGVCNKAVFSKVRGLLNTYQRTTREDSLGNLGHKGHVLVYNGSDIVVDNLCPANTFYWLNQDFAKLHVHKDNNMRVQKISDLETADAQLHRIFLYGAFIVSERNRNSKIEDITE